MYICEIHIYIYIYMYIILLTLGYHNPGGIVVNAARARVYD